MNECNKTIPVLFILLISISGILFFLEKKEINEIYRKLGGLSKNIEIISDKSEKEAAEISALIKQNQSNQTELITRYQDQVDKKISSLSGTVDFHTRSMVILLGDVKALITSCTEEIMNEKKSVNLLVDKKTVESDYATQQMLAEGFSEYKEDNFTEAANVYRKIINIYPTCTEALCYLNASLYYQNPGDGDNFPNIKRNLIYLLEVNVLASIEKKTALEVLKSISMEEGNTASMVQYQNSLQELREGE